MTTRISNDTSATTVVANNDAAHDAELGTTHSSLGDEKPPTPQEEAVPAIVDLYKPLPRLEGVPDEENPLTVRAVVVGIILGSLVNASNVYLGMLPWLVELRSLICRYARGDEQGLTFPLLDVNLQVSKRVSSSEPPCSVPSSVSVS